MNTLNSKMLLTNSTFRAEYEASSMQPRAECSLLTNTGLIEGEDAKCMVPTGRHRPQGVQLARAVTAYYAVLH